MKKVSLLLIGCFLISLFSCTINVQDILRQKTLDDIEIDVSNAKKLEYLIGQEFNPEGIKIIGKYSDGTKVEEDIRLAEFSGFDSSKANESLPISVNYKNFEKEFNIKIFEATVSSVAVSREPNKLFYNLGDALDLSGLILVSTYTNGAVLELTEEDFTVQGFDSTIYGDKQVNFILNSNPNIFTSIQLHVRNYTIESLEVKKFPNRLLYMEGENLELDGMVIEAHSSTGSNMTLNDNEYLVIPDNITDLEAGDYDIKIYVNDVETSFTIKIVKAYVVGAVATVKGTQERIDKSQIFYCDGDIFKLEEYDYYELLSDNNLGEQITKENEKWDNLSCALNENAIEGEGIKTVLIDYAFHDVIKDEDTVVPFSFDICVTDSELIEISATWGGNGYPLGIDPDDSNEDYGKWTITGKFQNGEEISIDSKYCTFEYEEPYKLNEIEDAINKSKNSDTTHNVIVSYFDTRSKKVFKTSDVKDNICPVRIIPKVLKSVKLIKLPKTSYYTNEIFKITNLEAEGTYSDGTKYTYTENDTSKITWSIVGSLSPTDTNIILTFDSTIKFDLPIVVTDGNITSISIAKEIKRKELKYRLGKKDYNFLSDFVITAKYNNGKDEELNEKNNLVFNLERGKDEYGNLYVVYTNGKQFFTTNYYPENDDVKIELLPAFPKTISIQVDDDASFTTLDELLKNSQTKYNVTYEDNTQDTLYWDSTNNRLIDACGTYTITVENNKFVSINFCAKEKDNFEKDFANICLLDKIDFVREVKVTPNNTTTNHKNEAGKLKFRHAHEYKELYNSYFDADVYLYSGQKIKLADEQKEKITYELSYDKTKIHNIKTEGFLLVTYKDDVNNQYDSFHKVEVYPPMPTKVEINYPNNCEIGELISKLSYNIEYEDNITDSKITNKISANLTQTDDSKTEKIYNGISYYIQDNNNCLDDTNCGYFGETNKKNDTFDYSGLVIEKNENNLTFVENISSDDLAKKFTTKRKYQKNGNQIAYQKIEGVNYQLSPVDANQDLFVSSYSGKVTVTDNQDKNKKATMSENISIKPKIEKISFTQTSSIYLYYASCIGQKLKDVITFVNDKGASVYCGKIILSRGSDQKLFDINEDNLNKYGISLSELSTTDLSYKATLEANEKITCKKVFTITETTPIDCSFVSDVDISSPQNFMNNWPRVTYTFMSIVYNEENKSTPTEYSYQKIKTSSFTSILRFYPNKDQSIYIDKSISTNTANNWEASGVLTK